MNISDFTTDETTLEQQLLDVKAYAQANAKRFGWDLVANMTDAKLQEVIGKRKNSRGAINAVYAHVKPLDDARKAAGGEPAQDQPATTPEPVIEPVIEPSAEADTDKAATRKEKRRLAQKARRAAKRASK